MKNRVITAIVLSLVGGFWVLMWLLMGPVAIKTTEVEFISASGGNIHKPFFSLPLPLLRPPIIIEGIIFTHYDYRKPSYDLASIFGFEQEISLTKVELLEADFISDAGKYIRSITEFMDKDTPPKTLYVAPNEYLHNVFSKTFGIQSVPPDQWFVFSWNKLPITLGINTLVLRGTYCEASGCTEFHSEIKFRLYEQTRYSTELFERISGV